MSAQNSAGVTLVCPACRQSPRAWALNASLACSNDGCGAVYSWLTDAIPIVATEAAHERIDASDGPGAIPQDPGEMASWLAEFAPGSREFASIVRASIFLGAFTSERGTSFYRDLSRALLPDVRRARVLDLGCGAGNLSMELAALDAEVTGLDLDAHLLRWAERVSKPGTSPVPVRINAGAFEVGTLDSPAREGSAIQFVCGNVYDPPFPAGAFDLVACVNLLDALERPWPALRQAVAMVRPGGRLLFAQPDAWNAATTRPERWLARNERGWDAVFDRLGLESEAKSDGLEWTLVDAPRWRHVYTVHGRLLRKQG